MKGIVSLFLAILFFPAVGICQSSGRVSKKAVVSNYFTAYNDHNVEELVKKVTEDFKMYSVTGDTTTTDIAGLEHLRKWLVGYFRDLPNVASKMSDVHISGNYISFIETATWGNGKSQSSLAVYEVKEGKINRAWYYY